jgi:NADH:ubiquinone oxidoreductase subunit 6 (subunit J)
MSEWIDIVVYAGLLVVVALVVTVAAWPRKPRDRRARWRRSATLTGALAFAALMTMIQVSAQKAPSAPSDGNQRASRIE